MTDHIQQAITSLEHEIEAIDQRRGELVRAVDTMRPLVGAANGAGRGPAKAGRRPKKIGKRALKKRTNERTNEQKAGRRVVRSLPDGGAKVDSILSALRAKSPQSPRDLAKRTGFNLAALRYQMKPLLKQGLVTVTGATMNRQVSLGRAHAAKEEP